MSQIKDIFIKILFPSSTVPAIAAMHLCWDVHVRISLLKLSFEWIKHMSIIDTVPWSFGELYDGDIERKICTGGIYMRVSHADIIQQKHAITSKPIYHMYT